MHTNIQCFTEAKKETYFLGKNINQYSKFKIQKSNSVDSQILNIVHFINIKFPKKDEI